MNIFISQGDYLMIKRRKKKWGKFAEKAILELKKDLKAILKKKTRETLEISEPSKDLSTTQQSEKMISEGAPARKSEAA